MTIINKYLKVRAIKNQQEKPVEVQNEIDNEQNLMEKEYERILKEKIPTDFIIACRNVQGQIEFFLSQAEPIEMKMYLSNNIIFDCYFIQLTGDKQGESFCLKPGRPIAKGENYFFLNKFGKISICLNGFKSDDVENRDNIYRIAKTRKTKISIEQVLRLRDDLNGKEFICNFEDEDEVAKLVRLDFCQDILPRRNQYYETSYWASQISKFESW